MSLFSEIPVKRKINKLVNIDFSFFMIMKVSLISLKFLFHEFLFDFLKFLSAEMFKNMGNPIPSHQISSANPWDEQIDTSNQGILSKISFRFLLVKTLVLG